MGRVLDVLAGGMFMFWVKYESSSTTMVGEHSAEDETILNINTGGSVAGVFCQTALFEGRLGRWGGCDSGSMNVDGEYERGRSVGGVSLSWSLIW